MPASGPDFELWLEWEHFASWDADDPEDDFFNVGVHLPDGRRFGLNVWTYRMLERAHQQDVQTGDHLGGAYLLPPDLFVARRDRALLEAVVRDLLADGRIPTGWRETD